MADSRFEPDEHVAAILDENRVMAVATLRPDGWPQATMVGYVRDGLTLYFVVARDSQKLANIQRDGRVSLAVGRDDADRIRGVSMAAQASLVTDAGEIHRMNELVRTRYPGQAVYAPRDALSAVIRVRPEVVSLIDLTKSPGAPELFDVVDGELRPAS